MEQNDSWDKAQYQALCFQLAKLTKLGLRLLISTSRDEEAIDWAKSCIIGLEEGFPSIGENVNEKN